MYEIDSLFDTIKSGNLSLLFSKDEIKLYNVSFIVTGIISCDDNFINPKYICVNN
jgi:hypothetical protein